MPATSHRLRMSMSHRHHPAGDRETLAGTISGGKYYSDVKVTLAATDNLSGVAHTYYTLDGGSQVTYSGAFTVSAVAVIRQVLDRGCCRQH